MSLAWPVNFLIFALALTAVPILSADVPPCYRDLEVNFFDPNIVNEAFSLHAISQSNWNLINTELQRNMKQVPELIRERAKQIDPNPFESPFQPEAASELLQQALLEVFSKTLSIFHITNQYNIEEMFNYIRKRQRARLTACLGEEME